MLEGLLDHGGLVLVRDCVAASGAFVLHALLKAALEREGDAKVAFVALNAPFSHYARVAKKQGCNIVASRNKGSLVFLDLFSDPNTWKYSMSQKAENPLLPLYKTIRDALKSDAAGAEAAEHIVMVDDIALLEVIARGSRESVLDFLHYCRALRGQAKRCSLLVLVHEDVYKNNSNNNADDQSSAFLKTLEHSADVSVRVEPLTSGHAADVHGQISVTYRSKHAGQAGTKQQQFKVAESSVAFFSPGERVKV